MLAYLFARKRFVNAKSNVSHARQEQVGALCRQQQGRAILAHQNRPGVVRALQLSIDLQLLCVDHHAVHIQHRQIPSGSGDAEDLLVHVQGGDLLPVRVHRHQPAHTAGLVPVQQQGGEAVPVQVVFPQIAAGIGVGSAHLPGRGRVGQAGVGHRHQLAVLLSDGSHQTVGHIVVGRRVYISCRLQAVKYHVADEHAVLLA